MMKTVICIALIVCVGVAYGSVVPPPENEQDLNIQPAAIEGDELMPSESRWGGGGWGGGYGRGGGGGYGRGWGGGYGRGWGGGHGGGYGGGWGHGGHGWGR